MDRDGQQSNTSEGRERKRHAVLKKKGEWVARNIKENRRESNREMRSEVRRPGGHGEHGEENEKYRVMLEVKKKLLVEKLQHQSKKSTRTSSRREKMTLSKANTLDNVSMSSRDQLASLLVLICSHANTTSDDGAALFFKLVNAYALYINVNHNILQRHILIASNK